VSELQLYAVESMYGSTLVEYSGSIGGVYKRADVDKLIDQLQDELNRCNNKETVAHMHSGWAGMTAENEELQANNDYLRTALNQLCDDKKVAVAELRAEKKLIIEDRDSLLEYRDQMEKTPAERIEELETENESLKSGDCYSCQGVGENQGVKCGNAE